MLIFGWFKISTTIGDLATVFTQICTKMNGFLCLFDLWEIGKDAIAPAKFTA
jgi:hypothetical protein